MPLALLDSRPPTDMKSLANALNQAQEGTGEVKRVLCSATFCPRLPGLTKMISKLSKEGAFRKGLEVFHALPELGIAYDTTITNAAISACDKGNQWQAALEIFRSMPALGLAADAITYSSVISALAKGKQWAAALQVFEDMQARGVDADVVTCCSLISALERGGQWQLAEQLFKQMCAAGQAEGGGAELRHLALMLDAQPAETDGQSSPLSNRSMSGLSWTTTGSLGNHAVSLLSGRSSFESFCTTSSESPHQRAFEAPSPRREVPAASWAGGGLVGLQLPGEAGSLPSAAGLLPPLSQGPTPPPPPPPRPGLLDLGKLPSLGTAVPHAAVAAPAASAAAAATESPRTPDRVEAAFKSSLYMPTGEAPPLAPPPQESGLPQPAGRARAPSPVAADGLPDGTAHAGSAAAPPSKELQAPPSPPSQGLAADVAGSDKLKALQAAAAAASAQRPPATAQLAINGCPLPVCLERARDPGSPLVPRLKHMRVGRIAPNRVCCNALLAAFARARPAQWHKAVALLEAMSEAGGAVSPDVVSYNTALKACGSAAKLDQALQVYRSMVARRVWPSITTFGTLLTAASHSGSYETVKQVWEWLLESGLEVSSACVHAYVSALAKRGHWDEARAVLQQTMARRGGAARPGPALRQITSLLPPAAAASLQQACAGLPPLQGAPPLPPVRPDRLLQQLAQLAPGALAADAPLLAAEALEAFQACAAAGPVQAASFAALLCCLGCAGLWDAALRVYPLVPVKDAVDAATASTLVAGHAAQGHLFWALHHWLAAAQAAAGGGAAPPSLDASRALLGACRARGAWQPALHVLRAMLAEQAGPSPDHACYSAALQALAGAGLLALVAQLLLLMPPRGLWPDAGVLAGVLSAIDPAAVSSLAASGALGTLLETMEPFGLGEAATLTAVTQLLEPASLPPLCLHLLNSLPLQGAEGSAEAHWAAIDQLLAARPPQTAAAVQICYHGHAVGALHCYTPRLAPAHGAADGHRDDSEPLLRLNLADRAPEQALAALLAWACACCEALAEGGRLGSAPEALLLLGRESAGAARRAQVIAAACAVYGGGCGHRLLPPWLRLPASPPLAARAAAAGPDGAAPLPLPLLSAWLAGARPATEALLAPL